MPPSRHRGPTGARVTLTFEPGLESKVARSAAVAAGLDRLIDEIAAAAQDAVPDESGHLKDSEEHGIFLTPAGWVGMVAYAAFYAHMVHFGTKEQPPNPWLQNAALNVILGRHAAGTPLA
jgi:hypothetical protein